ncbi:ABC transporter permease [Limoniibacter endophyticus]|uniref:Toluene ABC transporter permease n=1 Tax=Limoniibacter endophyticus TaxID=1565040 RepID=A0A8J3GG33_9HYPH|nr:ABC transporter permease [Limoniibacter endophyticus]GHC62685.1 toluene ABC transporter permease [Limoniibacter endophyticus]
MADSAEPKLDWQESGDARVLVLSGNWTTRRIHSVDQHMRKVERESSGQPLSLDLSQIGRMDTAGAWLIDRLIAKRNMANLETRIEGRSENADILLNAIAETREGDDDADARNRPNIVVRFLEALGRIVVGFYRDFIFAMHILGSTIQGAQMKAGRRQTINPAAIVSQIDKMGVGAIPIVMLMSAIVGAIVAQQGAFQLRYFGAEIFVVDLVSILVLRELGVLLTAIMIAGRSGSAITAEIGSMKMREEVDALTVIGLNPVGVLVFPRLVALVIALPCLTVAANFAALGGAVAVSYFYSGITPTIFIDRLRESIDLSTIFAGLIKAPFMALIIGILASVEGMKVGGSAESLGARVTSSVVKSIFVVIVVDGLFAMFYAAIDF